MKKLLVLLAFAMLSISLASASQIACTISGTTFNTPVNGTTVVTCGPLTFEDFSVPIATSGNGTTNTGQVDVTQTSSGPLASYYDTVTGVAYLAFNPNLQATWDDQFEFEVVGGINSIDMSVGGQNASVQETACLVALGVSGVCPTSDMLGQITVTSGQSEQFANFNSTTPVYIFKNINAGLAPAQLTEFTQSFGTSTVPEPISMVLLGSGLLGVGLLRRRSRKN